MASAIGSEQMGWEICIAPSVVNCATSKERKAHANEITDEWYQNGTPYKIRDCMTYQTRF